MPWDPFAGLFGNDDRPPPNRRERRAMDKVFRQQVRAAKKARARQRIVPQDGRD